MIAYLCAALSGLKYLYTIAQGVALGCYVKPFQGYTHLKRADIK